MKHVPFRLFAVCIVLPPLLYGFTTQGIIWLLARKYQTEIQQVCVGETAPLLAGDLLLKEAVRRHVDRYLRQQRLLSWGVTAKVWVTAGASTVLYPAPIEKGEAHLHQLAPLDIASENYALLRAGVDASVDVDIDFNRPLSNCLLTVYVFLAIGLLYGVYQVGVRRSRLAEVTVRRQLNRLLRQETESARNLSVLQRDRARLEAALAREKQKAGSQEAELFEEIIALDENLTRNLKLQEHQRAEIAALHQQIENYEKEHQRSRAPKKREMDVLSKRFATLYKHLTIHQRAVEGFVALTEEMRLKGEEMIYRLNEAPDQVPIKRKVFGRKGRETVWEVLFAYNGRMYFRKFGEQQIEVLAIGTKNTQARDLVFIDAVARKGESG